MPEDLKLSQIGSSLLLTPFRGLHSPRVRKYCQIIFACYFWKLSDAGFPPPCAPIKFHPLETYRGLEYDVKLGGQNARLTLLSTTEHCSHMWVHHQQKAKRCYKQLVTKAGCCSALKHNSAHSLTLQQSDPQFTHTHTRTHARTHTCMHTHHKQKTQQNQQQNTLEYNKSQK